DKIIVYDIVKKAKNGSFLLKRYFKITYEEIRKMERMKNWAKKVLEEAKKDELEVGRALEQKQREKEEERCELEDLMHQVIVQVEKIVKCFVDVLEGSLAKESEEDAERFVLRIKLRYGDVLVSIPQKAGVPGYPEISIGPRYISESFRRRLKSIAWDDDCFFVARTPDCGRYYLGDFRSNDIAKSRFYAFYWFPVRGFKKEEFMKALENFCESAMSPKKCDNIMRGY
ncbi:MAG: hypothetical protein Q8M94_20625, partial [Ignavibacteria bacterium]|nr:hypothetical protein [Ignavibacteria bacterium]